jgi:hypothetical protein
MDFPFHTTKQNEHFQKRLRCPLCSSSTLTPFLRRVGVPVLTNLLMDTQEAACQIPRGNILLVICENCGFVFNRAFEASARYNSLDDNSQAYAPSFEHYLDDLVHF